MTIHCFFLGIFDHTKNQKNVIEWFRILKKIIEYSSNKKRIKRRFYRSFLLFEFWKIRNRVLNNIFCYIEIYVIYNIKLLKNVIAMSKKFQKIKKFFSLFDLKIKQKSKKTINIIILLHNFTTSHFQHKCQKEIVD